LVNVSKRVAETPYFYLEQIADGVFAAISSDPVWTVANAGIVDLGDRTLVFDSLSSPRAAEALKRTAEDVTGKPVSMVVNSHHHLDHSLGNQVFSGATIASSAITRDLMHQRFERFLREAADFPAQLETIRARLSQPLEPDLRAQLEPQAKELEMSLGLLTDFQPALPNLTFERTFELHGSTRRVVIEGFNGHTGSDVVMILPDDGVIFAADLVVVDHLGFMAHGDPDAWLQTLEALEKLQHLPVLVPGHGGVTAPAAIPAMRAYLLEMMRLAESVSDQADFEHINIPDAWRDWGLLEGFRPNLEFLFARSRN
jgi:cyclase